MRISDWISDVCSSDLGQAESSTLAGDATRAARQTASATRCAVPDAGSPRVRPGPWPPAETRIDQKRVVKGKRESCRLGLGGRRIIKKKIHGQHKTNTNTKIDIT